MEHFHKDILENHSSQIQMLFWLDFKRIKPTQILLYSRHMISR